jgi:hypothetical protein
LMYFDTPFAGLGLLSLRVILLRGWVLSAR